MSAKTSAVTRRRFLKTAAKASAVFVAPQFVPGSALGKNGAVAPSERIVMGGLGIGRRGGYDLGIFLDQPDVQFVGICDVRAERRKAVKEMADTKYGSQDCDTYRDLHEFLDPPVARAAVSRPFSILIVLKD